MISLAIIYYKFTAKSRGEMILKVSWHLAKLCLRAIIAATF